MGNCGEGCRSQWDSFVIASVGGQGGLLATGVLALMLEAPGLVVKTSEVHGMAQRGGSVISFVRRGRGAFPPLVDRGQADVVLGLELLEAVRALPFLKPGGLVVANTQQVMPVPVLTGQSRYPSDLAERLRAAAGRLILAPAGEIAAELGTARVANVVCLGALAACADWPEAAWRQAISGAVPPRTVSLNLAAFERGLAVGREQLA
jgi:indolepyruvate ferredoxin oxidoreductase beta subunit